jgi:hypothetical protein
MHEPKINWKNMIKRILFILLFAAIGFGGGYLLAPHIENITFFGALYAVSVFIFSFPLHVILHEFGHILGGLISGYDFIMFRLFDTVWIKTEEGLSKRKEYIPGVQGQALMIPPATEDNKQPPFLLYHASGILVNLLTGVIFILLGRTLTIDWLVQFFYISSIVAFLLAIANAIPLKGTDGYNISQMLKHDSISSELTNLLTMYQDMVGGASLESLQKYVDLDALGSLENPNTATVYSLRASYLFDEHDFEGARDIYQTLYRNQGKLFAGHQADVTLNYLYALLLTEPDNATVASLINTNTYKQFTKIKQSNYLRIQAAVAMYHQGDFKKTAELLAEGEQYIHLAPTLTEEHFEEAQYDYLNEELERLKANHAVVE